MLRTSPAQPAHSLPFQQRPPPAALLRQRTHTVAARERGSAVADWPAGAGLQLGWDQVGGLGWGRWGQLHRWVGGVILGVTCSGGADSDSGEPLKEQWNGLRFWKLSFFVHPPPHPSVLSSPSISPFSLFFFFLAFCFSSALTLSLFSSQAVSSYTNLYSFWFLHCLLSFPFCFQSLTHLLQLRGHGLGSQRDGWRAQPLTLLWDCGREIWSPSSNS